MYVHVHVHKCPTTLRSMGTAMGKQIKQHLQMHATVLVDVATCTHKHSLRGTNVPTLSNIIPPN